MSLLSLNSLKFTWSGPNLLDGIDLEIGRGERIGLLGRNGCGKSTLLKILTGEVTPDNGDIRRTNDLRIARLVQEVPQETTGTIYNIVSAGHHSTNDWQRQHATEKILSRMSLEGETEFSTLSSGMKRRVLLARALSAEPDILLLDEPTNHLDIESISWLERFLKGIKSTLVFVTHDRVFLQALATRIIEIDRGKLFDWFCDYATFLKRKQQMLDAEEKQNELFDKKLAQEETWIRQGIKARRTRNEGRVRALKKMREERRQRRRKVGNVQLQAAEAEKSGQLVIEVKEVCFSYDDRTIVRNLSTLITRGDRIGIIGPNGSGKTTLLKLLLGQLEPDDGSIRHGTRMEVIYFDQLREQIDEEKTVVENVGEGQEMLNINGRNVHIYGYLQDFLFTPERARRPARYLSGGERNRIMLAQMFKRPSNVMVLDEPTNDLDAETLELLEELVSNYAGTLLLVSHDRAFLNNVVTSTFAFGEDGIVREYAGGYDDYLLQSSHVKLDGEADSKLAARKSLVTSTNNKQKKLSYNEQRELDQLPDQIGQLEDEQAKLHGQMMAPEFFKQESDVIAAANARLQEIESELEKRLSRWEELESRV